MADIQKKKREEKYFWDLDLNKCCKLIKPFNYSLKILFLCEDCNKKVCINCFTKCHNGNENKFEKIMLTNSIEDLIKGEKIVENLKRILIKRNNELNKNKENITSSLNCECTFCDSKNTNKESNSEINHKNKSNEKNYDFEVIFEHKEIIDFHVNFKYLENFIKKIEKYTEKMHKITMFKLFNSSIIFRKKIRLTNQEKFKKNFNLKYELENYIEYILDKVEINLEEIDKIKILCNFLLDLCLFLLVEKKLIYRIFNFLNKVRREFEKKYEEETEESKINEQKINCQIISKTVDKIFTFSQIHFKDLYFTEDQSKESSNENFKIEEYMNLMNFDNPLHKYWYLVTLTNFDPYSRQIKEYRNTKTIKENFCIKIDPNEAKIFPENKISPSNKEELKIKIYDFLNKWFESETLKCPNFMFNVLNNQNISKKLSENALLENEFINEIKVIFEKLKDYDDEFQTLFFNYVSLYLYFDNCLKFLIYTVEIHKMIKSLKSFNIIAIKFVYLLLIKSQIGHLEFLNKSVNYYIFSLMKTVKFNYDDDNEKILYMLKIMALLNKNINYSVSLLGKDVIKKMSTFFDSNFDKLVKQSRTVKELYHVTTKNKNEILNEKIDCKNKTETKNEIKIDEIIIKELNQTKNNETIKFKKFLENLGDLKHEDPYDNEDSIFFHYLEYLCDFTYFDEEIQKEMFNFFEKVIQIIEEFLKFEDLKERRRVIIIKFLSNFITSEYINSKNFIVVDKYIKDSYFDQCIQQIENFEDPNSNINLMRYQMFFERIIEILIEEIKLIKKTEYYEKNNKSIVKEIAKSVQKITDMFHNKSDKWIIPLYFKIYLLTIEFIEKAQTIYQIFVLLTNQKSSMLNSKLIEIKDSSFNWKKSQEICRILTEIFVDIHILERYLTIDKDIKSFIYSLKKLNHPFDKTVYLENLQDLYLKDTDTNLDIYYVSQKNSMTKKEEKFENLDEMTRKSIEGKWRLFVDDLGLDNTKTIFSFFNYLMSILCYRDSFQIEKYNKLIEIFDESYCNEILHESSSKKFLICLDVMNSLLFTDTKKIQILLRDFSKKNNSLFNNFFKNLSIFLKKHLFFFIESSYYENSKQLAKNYQTVFNLLDFLIRLKDEFCLFFVEYITKDFSENLDKNKESPNKEKNDEGNQNLNMSILIQSNFNLNQSILFERERDIPDERVSNTDNINKNKTEEIQNNHKKIKSKVSNTDNININKNEEIQNNQKEINNQDKSSSNEKNSSKIEGNSIFGILCQSFKKICNILEKTLNESNSFPCERLITFYLSISNFLREYIEGLRKSENEEDLKNIKNCLIKNLSFKLLFVNNPDKQKRLFIVQNQFISLLTSIFIEFKPEEELVKDLFLFFEENISPLDILEQIVIFLDSLKIKLNYSKLELNLYLNNEKFISSNELKLCVKYCILILHWKGKNFVRNLKKHYKSKIGEKFTRRSIKRKRKENSIRNVFFI